MNNYEDYEAIFKKRQKRKKAILLTLLFLFVFAVSWFLGTFLVALISMNTKFDIAKVPNYITNPLSIIIGIAGVLAAFIYWLVTFINKKDKKGPGARRASSNLYDDARFLTSEELDLHYGIDLGKKHFSPVLLSNVEKYTVNGLVINSGITAKGDYYFHRTDNVHSIVVGTTGTGKTKFMLIPTVLMMAKSSNKPSMVVIDIKGEIIEKTYNTLKDNGYNVHILDFRRPEASEKYNPLSIIIDYYDKYHEDKVKNSTYRYRYESEISKLAELIVPSDKASDNFWAMAGQSIFKAIIQGMLEDYEKNKNLPDEEKKFTKDMFTFATISEINCLSSAKFFNYFFERDQKSLARKLATGQILSNYDHGNMNKTLLSIMSTYTTEFDKFVDVASQDLTIKSDFDASELKNKKTALFLLLPDEDRSKYALASLVINQVYSLLVFESQRVGYEKTREVHLILDEFANLPKIKEIDNWLSVGRERKLFISIFIQAVSQLEDKYGKDFAKTIIQNCNMKIVLGLGEPGSVDYFKHLFGTYTIVSTSSSQGYKENSGSENQSLNKADLITSTQFMNMKPGEIYFLELKQHPGHTRIIPIFDDRFTKLLDIKEYKLDKREINVVPEQEKERFVYQGEVSNRVPTSEEARAGHYFKKDEPKPKDPKEDTPSEEKPKEDPVPIRVDGVTEEPIPTNHTEIRNGVVCDEDGVIIGRPQQEEVTEEQPKPNDEDPTEEEINNMPESPGFESLLRAMTETENDIGENEQKGEDKDEK